MKDILLKILYRAAELLITSVVLSSIVTGLNVAGILTTRGSTLAALIVGAVIYIVLNIRFSRNSFFRLRNLLMYYIVSAAAFLLFSVILLGVYKICGNVVFTWMFAVAKFAVYISDNISTFLAVGFFEFVLLLVIAIAPLGMNFLIMYHDNQNED